MLYNYLTDVNPYAFAFELFLSAAIAWIILFLLRRLWNPRHMLSLFIQLFLVLVVVSFGGVLLTASWGADEPAWASMWSALRQALENDSDRVLIANLPVLGLAVTLDFFIQKKRRLPWGPE